MVEGHPGGDRAARQDRDRVCEDRERDQGKADAVNASKTDKTVADATKVLNDSKGRVEDDKVRTALENAIKSKDGKAISDAVKAVNDSVRAKSDADAKARAEKEEQAAESTAQAPDNGSSYTGDTTGGYTGYTQSQGGYTYTPQQSTGGGYTPAPQPQPQPQPAPQPQPPQAAATVETVDGLKISSVAYWGVIHTPADPFGAGSGTASESCPRKPRRPKTSIRHTSRSAPCRSVVVLRGEDAEPVVGDGVDDAVG